MSAKQPKYRYRKLALSDGTKRDEHRVIVECRLGRRLDRNEIVHHKNGNGHDNSPSNLELMPRSAHSRMHQQGEGGSKAKLRQADVIAIRASNERRAVLAQRYGVSLSTISNIRSRRTWRHI